MAGCPNAHHNGTLAILNCNHLRSRRTGKSPLRLFFPQKQEINLHDRCPPILKTEPTSSQVIKPRVKKACVNEPCNAFAHFRARPKPGLDPSPRNTQTCITDERWLSLSSGPHRFIASCLKRVKGAWCDHFFEPHFVI